MASVPSALRRTLSLALVAAVLLAARGARAEGPWVDRRITLPDGDWAFDLGLGVARAYAPPVNPAGPGFNLEAAVGLTRDLELGVRTGLRMGDDAQDTHADEYGRLFDRETFDTGGGAVANPEVRLRGAVVHSGGAEVALEARAFLPVNQGTRFGTELGLPLLFRIGNAARIDTGVWVPIIFTNPIDTYFSAPFDLWFQPTPRLWLGPETGVVFHSVNNHVSVPLGFGLGYQFTRTLDLKTQLLFPAINDDQGAQSFGLGVGIQVRVE